MENARKNEGKGYLCGCFRMKDMEDFLVYWNGLGYDKAVLVLAALFFVWHAAGLFFRSRLLRGGTKEGQAQGAEGVSVILTCANKAEALEAHLEAFLEQDYPEFEVVVVDECSEDDTQEVLSKFQERYPHLKTSRIPSATKFRRTKKIAIHIGVLAAKYDVLLFSEITCKPAGREWLRTMAGSFGERTSVVLGFANYVEGAGTGVKRYFRILRFWKTLWLARLGLYVTGDGCNMGYRKRDYLEARGYTERTQSYLGYDADMVRKLGRRGRVEVVQEPAAYVLLDDTSRKAWEDDYLYYYAQRGQWGWKAWAGESLDFAVEACFYAAVLHLAYWEGGVWWLAGWLAVNYLCDVLTVCLSLKRMGQRGLTGVAFAMNAAGFLFKGYYLLCALRAGKKWK